MRKALIIGIHSEEGFYLVKLLLNQDFEVYTLGSVDLEAFSTFYKFNKAVENLKNRLYKCAIASNLNISNLILEINPDVIYNLVEDNIHNCQVEQDNTISIITTVDIIKAVKGLTSSHAIKIFQASSLNFYDVIIG